MTIVKQFGNISVDISFPDDPEDFKVLQEKFEDTLASIICKKLQPGEIDMFEQAFMRDEVTI